MRILALVILFTSRLLACSCSPLSVCEKLDRSVIFIGKVIEGGVASLTDDPWYSHATHARFKVLEVFRGLPARTDTVDVELGFIPGMCSPNPYYMGQSYLVMVNRYRGMPSEGGCTTGHDVRKSADEVQYVRDYFSGKVKTSIHGRVGTGGNSGFQFRILSGQMKPLSTARVIATRGSSEFTATSDAEGKYSLPLPEGGAYKVRAVTPYHSGEEQTIEVPIHGCKIQNLGIPTHNVVSGRVQNSRGQPVKDAIVGLIDLDYPSNTDVPYAWVEPVSSDSNGRYRFSKVPAGRYLLVTNPEGPYGIRYNVPFETTYYPLGSNRGHAKIVEIGNKRVELSGMNLTTGQQVKARRLTVTVTFPDGKPMKTARVECTGEPIEPGGLVWKRVILDGAAIQAPVNRRLTIEVTDAFGRDLKAKYSSTHEPGSDAIVQKFVIKP